MPFGSDPFVHESPTMFAFVGNVDGPTVSRTDETVPKSASPDSQPPRPRRKRSQVSRACDWCRVHRIKCDNHYPCLNCQNRGGQCSNDRSNEFRTLPHAFREIERLRKRNQELQKELEEERTRNRSQAAPPAGASNPQAPTSQSDPWVPHPAPSRSIDDRSSSQWEGVFTSTARSPAKTWYGASSLLYFINRVNICLSSRLQRQFPEHSMQPNSASRLLDGPASPPDKPTDVPSLVSRPDITKEYLTASQEEYFLNLYWQSHHISLLALNEDDFKQHYKSLWTGSRKTRKPSALVDIVLALCMQYGMAQRQAKNNPSLRSADIDTNDATLAGRWHYCRCQTLLACELESPKISTLQCYILSVVWLCWASFQNMADSTLAIATRTAQMLGLHLPPPQDMPQREKDLRKRLWWSIYVAEAKTSMKLGRPFMLHLSQAGVGLPSDDHEAAARSGSDFAPLDDHTTWLSWDLHNTKLVLAVRNIYTAFYDKYLGIFNNDGIAISTVEAYADSLSTHMKTLERWVQDVPSALKIPRKDHGTPFSTDCSPLDMEQFAPLWVQRQRLLLELLYHNLCVNLYRPFIWLKPAALHSQSTLSVELLQSTPFADTCCRNCASHAMEFTSIMRQVMSTTDLLTGWHEAFGWQWSCAISLVAYVLTYSHDGEQTRAAREAINDAIEVLNSFGGSFAVAASAANVVRSLSATVDQIVASQRHFMSTLQLGAEEHGAISHGDQSVGMMPLTEQPSTTVGQINGGFPDWDGEALVTVQGILSGSMDMAFAIDGYNSTYTLWPNNAGPTG
ncbi:hypothetical protein F5Y05DRAFT_3292 [Hypoxylon sp. FL0543]|nr:hypothetical protein F5Y05DRAFT_3292 [Hypoxylon sp. FL0543]